MPRFERAGSLSSALEELEPGLRRGDAPVVEPLTNDPRTTLDAPPPAEDRPPSLGDRPRTFGPESLTALGLSIGSGFLVLGALAAILVAVEASPAPAAATLSTRIARGARAAWLLLAFAFAGWCAFSLLRFLARVLREWLDQQSRRSQQLESELNRLAGLLERIVPMLAQREESGGLEPAASLARSRAAAELDAAVRGGKWALAESLLAEFETAFPDDPKSSAFRASLVAARRSSIEERLAELAAARQVNDPARVLELYRSVVPELDREALGPLRSAVAQWFLGLIYRRLRTGKIQLEVVELATHFADSFAATTEGASVQAALPTLRRSAGLCPRCAQPYTGVDQACPECLRPSRQMPAPPGTANNSVQPE